MSNLQCIKDIQVGFSKIGSRGVFAKKPFKKGQVIEEAPFIAVYKEHILGKPECLQLQVSAGYLSQEQR